MNTMIKRIPGLLIAFAATCFSTQVLAAATVDPTTQPAWGIGSFTLKQSNLKLGASNAYRTWFENGAWQGDVIEYNVDTAGNRTTDITVGLTPAEDGVNNWSVRYEFSNQEATITDYWKSASGRKIVTWDGSFQAPFRFDTLSSGQRIQLDPNTLTTGSYDSPILNFIRGDRSQDSQNGGILRIRYNLMGDPGKNAPVYVGAPNQALPLSGYAQYAEDNANRAGRLFVASNDGMIHVFDADTGIEVYAYVPSMLFTTLEALTIRDYIHTWYADGQLVSGDAKIGSNWKTIVAGGLGAGAKGLFTLDATTSSMSSETSTAAADNKVLGELTGNGLGYIHGKPSIAPLSNGAWYVISGNGYSSNTGTAVLYMISLNTGTATTIATNSVTGNGLSAPALIDTDGDTGVDIAFAGDLLGNMWKFDLNNPNTAAELLFSAGASKPITTAPDVAVHPNGGYLVTFGTGSLLSTADAGDTSQQTLYAIWDYPNRSATVEDTVDGDGNAILLSQTLSIDTYVSPAPDSITRAVRTVTNNAPNWSYNRGWKVDLSTNTGERVINDVTIRGNRLQLVTDLPVTAEELTLGENPVGLSWLLELHWLSGGDVNKVFFDMNGDGNLNNSDKVTQDNISFTVPVGISLGQGNRSQPTFARVANGIDTIFINGLNLAVFTCEGVCSGGLQGGHIDVDTDAASQSGLGGSTDNHTHQYDDKFNLTFMDYFELMMDDQVDAVSIDETTEFVVVLANADLSPGGRIFIGNKFWNVKAYQEIIQQRLTSYNGANTSTLVDDDGDSLVFTLKGITDLVDGALKISFPDTAIIEGGLHPTQTSCVKKQLTITNGRWRNGALTIHLIQLDTIGSGASSGNSWIAQNPTDLTAGMVGGGMHANLANDSGFLYESTLFWHFGDLAKEIIGVKPCYGDPEWAAAAEVERNGLTLEEFSNLFPAYAQQQDYIDSLLNQLESITCDKGTGRDCKKEKEYKELEKLLKELVGDVKKFLKLRGFLNTGGSGGSGTGDLGDGSGGNAADVDGEGDEEENTEYTATPTGRRSWIDIRS